MKKILIVAILTAVSTSVWAQKRSTTSSAPRASSTAPSSSQTSTHTSTWSSPGKFTNDEGSQIFSGALGFVGTNGFNYNVDSTNQGSQAALSGLFALGAEYEYMFHEDIGLGGLFRYYSTSDDLTTDVKYSYSYWGLGPMARFHIPNNMFDFSFGTGFLLGAPSGKREPKNGTTTKLDGSVHFLPFINLGVMYKVTSAIAVGVDTTRVMAIGSQLNGLLQEDFMFKVRFHF